MSMYPIASTVLSSNGNLSFTGIPATFAHLQLRAYGRSADSGTAARQIYVNFNNDGTNIAGHYLIGDGTNPSTGNALTAMYAAVGAMPASGNTANAYGSAVIDVLDYANTSKFKTLKSTAGVDLNGSGVISFCSGHWRSTAAVTSIQLSTEGNFLAGSRFELYGISNSPMTGA